MRAWLYSYTVLVVTAAALFSALSQPLVGHETLYAPFFVAILLAAWSGRYEITALAIVLSITAGIFVGAPSPSQMQREEWMRSLLFLPSAIIVGTLTAHMRRLEQRARDGEEWFRASQELSLDAFTILEAIRDDQRRIVDFRWTYVNPQAGRALGALPRALEGQRLLDRLPGNRDELFALYCRVVETGEAHDIEVRYVRDGIDGWFRNMAVRLGDGVAVSFRDITSTKRAEEELREADRLKDNFLVMLGHEMRQPLNALRAASQVARVLVESDRVLRPLEVIDRQVSHLTRLVDDLVDASRIKRGRLELVRRRVDLRETVRAAAETIRPLVVTNRQVLAAEIPSEPVLVNGDPDRLQQVLVNLLANATRHTPEDGRISVSLVVEDSAAILEVRDTGRGIRPDVLPRIFDLFVQGEESPSGGMGIGLAVVRGLVDLHGGTVHARSDGANQGSVFTVTLPLERVPTPVALHS